MIPAALVHLENIVKELAALKALFGEAFSQQMVELTESDLEAEAALSEAMASPGTQAAFDGSKLRGIFAFLKASGLLDILLAKVLGG